MKPASFFDLPGSLQESLLWDMELDYDSYESSKAEKIHEIMVYEGHIKGRNRDVINTAYRFMDEEMLRRRAMAELELVNDQVKALTALIS